MVEIRRIRFVDDECISGLNRLIPQQSPTSTHESITEEELRLCLQNPNFFILVALDTEKTGPVRYVGTATIFFQRNIVRWIAEIHDVVVDEASRGRGIGEQLTNELLLCARVFAARCGQSIKLYLTSRPSRVAANALYQKLGFTLVAKAEGEWGTNLYKLVIRP